MLRRMVTFAAVSGLAFALASAVQAASIPVNNHSFEHVGPVNTAAGPQTRGVDILDGSDGFIDGHLYHHVTDAPLNQPTSNTNPQTGTWVTSENAGDAIAYDARWPSWHHGTNAGPTHELQALLLDNRGPGKFGQVTQDLGSLNSLGIATGYDKLVMTFDARFGTPGNGDTGGADADVEFFAFFEVNGARDTANQFHSDMSATHVDDGGTRKIHKWTELGLDNSNIPSGRTHTPSPQTAGGITQDDHMGHYTVELPLGGVDPNHTIGIGIRYEDNRAAGGCCGARTYVDNVRVESVAGAMANDGTLVVIQNGTVAWSDTTNWVGGVIADGIGATATIQIGGNWNYTVDIDSNRTLGSWVTSGGGGFNTLNTSGGAVLTWDTGGASDAICSFAPGNMYDIRDNRDMYLQSDLDWGNGKLTQRHHYLRGQIAGPGKLTFNIGSGNLDSANNIKFTIEGSNPNTYQGGTDLNLFVSTGAYGKVLLDDERTARLNKDGAVGTGDVNLAHIHTNLRITSSGGAEDRISDTAALRLKSGYDPDYASIHTVGYFHTNVILDSGVGETIDKLYMNGFLAPAGTYGSGSDPIWFSGAGTLTVTNGSAAPASYASTGAGNWNAGGTWGGTAPSYFDGASVGHAVVVAADAAARNVAFTGGSLTVNPGTKLLVQDTFNPSGGTVTVNGTLETLNLPSTTGLSLGAGSKLTVGRSMVVDSNFDASAAATLELPGSFANDSITITSSGVLTLGAVDLIKPRELHISGTLNTGGNVLMELGGKLSGGGTIILPDTSKRVEIKGGQWQVIQQGGWGGTGVAPGDGLGTLTVQNGEFELERSGRDGTPNYYEWEVGQPGETDLVSVVNGLLDLRFSYDNSPEQIEFRILDANGYVASPTDKLDLFTYDANSSIEVNEVAGLVQGITADSFDTSLLDATWTVGTLELWHEQYADSSGHVYLTGLSGGTFQEPEDIIPEPVTMAMLGLGVAGLGGYVRRRKRF